MSTTDQYRWSYGSASVGFETQHVSIKLRRAVSSLILVRCRRSLHVNLAIYVNYRLCNRDVSVRRMAHAAVIVAAWCQISHTCVHNTITSSIWRFFINSFNLLLFISLSNAAPNIAPIIEVHRFHIAFVSKHCLHHQSSSSIIHRRKKTWWWEVRGEWTLFVVRVQSI
jgi:hypothetical protein